MLVMGRSWIWPKIEDCQTVVFRSCKDAKNNIWFPHKYSNSSGIVNRVDYYIIYTSFSSSGCQNSAYDIIIFFVVFKKAHKHQVDVVPGINKSEEKSLN